MSADIGWGIALGLTLGLGLWTIVSALPSLSRPRLYERLAPYLVDVSASAREVVNRRSVDPLPVLGALAEPLFVAGRRFLAQTLGGTETIQLRLRQSGSRMSIERFRTEQIVWGLIGGAVGGVLVLATGQWLLPVLGVAIGVLLRDFFLRRAAEQRMRRIASEFPTVVEFLTLSLSAGEGIFESLRRVGAVSNGEIAGELRLVVGDVSAGVPLAAALTTMARELQYMPLARCVDHMIAALERGAPLVDVLRGQAQDARDVAKRELLESAGKKELTMLMPLVFAILPTTIAFAIWPGFFVLTTVF